MFYGGHTAEFACMCVVYMDRNTCFVNFMNANHLQNRFVLKLECVVSHHLRAMVMSCFWNPMVHCDLIECSLELMTHGECGCVLVDGGWRTACLCLGIGFLGAAITSMPPVIMEVMSEMRFVTCEMTHVTLDTRHCSMKSTIFGSG